MRVSHRQAPLVRRNREHESSAFSEFGLDPDTPAKPFDDLLADG
jgi:hypothetical protein